MIEVEKIIGFNDVSFYKKGTFFYHREDGPAIEFADGTKKWYFNGRMHREGGPAYESDGYEEWWINGNLHREDGPARVISGLGVEWYLNGVCFDTKERWFEELTEEQKKKALYSEYFIRG